MTVNYISVFGGSTSSPSNTGYGEAPTIKSQIINLIRSIRMVVKCE